MWLSLGFLFQLLFCPSMVVQAVGKFDNYVTSYYNCAIVPYYFIIFNKIEQDSHPTATCFPRVHMICGPTCNIYVNWLNSYIMAFVHFETILLFIILFLILLMQKEICFINIFITN